MLNNCMDYIGLFDNQIKQNPFKFARERAMLCVRDVIEYSLELEADQAAGCGKHARSPGRKDVRNGYYKRSLNLKDGPITLSVPRLRHTPLNFKAFGLFERHSEEFVRLIVDAFAYGHSTRKIAQFLKRNFAVILSAQAISNIIAKVDRQVERFHRRPLIEAFRFLQIDGMGITCAGEKMTALIALGFNNHDDATVLSYRIVKAEEKWECVSFLRDLENRGFPFDKVELVTHDDSGGIRAALDYVLPFVPRQLCIFHKLKNLKDALSGSARKGRMMRDACAIYEARDALGARFAKNAFARAWARWERKAVKNFTRDFEKTIAFYEVEREMQKRVRTNNPLERRIREVRRRTKTMGAFKDAKSADRMIYLALKAAGLIGIHPENEFTHIS